MRARLPEPVERFPEGGVFPVLGAFGRERLRDRLLREAPGPELPLDPRAAVPGAPKPDGRACGREVVEQTLLGQPVERLRDRAGHEAPFAERPRELRAAARPDREQAQGPLAGRRRGRGLPGR